MSTTEYQPKYIEGDVEEAIPVAGMDSWDRGQKLAKLRLAEALFEADVNDGAEIPEEDRETAHELAVSALTTYYLAVGIKSPDSLLAGDFADDGEGKSEFLDRVQGIYERARDAILNASGDESGGAGSENDDTGAGNVRSELL